MCFTVRSLCWCAVSINSFPIQRWRDIRVKFQLWEDEFGRRSFLIQAGQDPGFDKAGDQFYPELPLRSEWLLKCKNANSQELFQSQIRRISSGMSEEVGKGSRRTVLPRTTRRGGRTESLQGTQTWTRPLVSETSPQMNQCSVSLSYRHLDTDNDSGCVLLFSLQNCSQSKDWATVVFQSSSGDLTYMNCHPFTAVFLRRKNGNICSVRCPGLTASLTFELLEWYFWSPFGFPFCTWHGHRCVLPPPDRGARDICRNRKHLPSLR